MEKTKKADKLIISTEVVNLKEEFIEDMYVGDTGAFSHMVRSTAGVFDMKQVNIPAQMGH